MARLGKAKGVAQVRQPKLLDARALAMVDKRIHGRSLQSIAEEFNVSIDTVTRSLERAEKMNLAERYEDYLYGRLGALALGAYEHALLENDTAVATKVLESLGLIKKAREQRPEGGEPEGDTWEAYLKVRRPAKKVGNEAASSADHSLQAGGPPEASPRSLPQVSVVLPAPPETVDGTATSVD